MKKRKLENPEFKYAVGQSTLLQIDWKSWKEEFPPKRVNIFIIIKLKDGYYPVTGEYSEVVIPASADGTFPATTWKKVQFDNYELPEIFINDNDENVKRLIAWGRAIPVMKLSTKCEICEKLQCGC